MTDNVVRRSLKLIGCDARCRQPHALAGFLDCWGEATDTPTFGRGRTAANVIARGRNGAVDGGFRGCFCVIRDTAEVAQRSLRTTSATASGLPLIVRTPDVHDDLKRRDSTRPAWPSVPSIEVESHHDATRGRVTHLAESGRHERIAGADVHLAPGDCLPGLGKHRIPLDRLRAMRLRVPHGCLGECPSEALCLGIRGGSRSRRSPKRPGRLDPRSARPTAPMTRAAAGSLPAARRRPSPPARRPCRRPCRWWRLPVRVAAVRLLAQSMCPLLDRHVEPCPVAQLDPLALALRRGAAPEHRLQVVPARFVRGNHGYVAFRHRLCLAHAADSPLPHRERPPYAVGVIHVAMLRREELTERNAFVSARCRVRDILSLRWIHGHEYTGPEVALQTDVASRRRGRRRASVAAATLAGCTSGDRVSTPPRPITSTTTPDVPPATASTPPCTGADGRATLTAMLADLSRGKHVDVGTYFVPPIQFVRWVDPSAYVTFLPAPTAQ